MKTKQSKRLVIDASVARACGGTQSTYPTSVHCRDFLENVLNICHQVVMTSEIHDEWNRHMKSRFAIEWRRSMVAKGKLIPLKDLPLNQMLWKELEDFAKTDKQRQEIVKDICLLEAALATDKIVISLDDNTARKYFSQAAQQIQSLKDSLKDIVWVNPDHVEQEQPIAWLAKGAPYEENRTLGQYQC
jgi:hypothetical protein